MSKMNGVATAGLLLILFGMMSFVIGALISTVGMSDQRDSEPGLPWSSGAS